MTREPIFRDVGPYGKSSTNVTRFPAVICVYIFSSSASYSCSVEAKFIWWSKTGRYTNFRFIIRSFQLRQNTRPAAENGGADTAEKTSCIACRL